MVPPRLYKYLKPERIDVLTSCRIRFSQRNVFDDDHELAPDYAAFGTEAEMWKLVLLKPFRSDPRVPMNILLRIIAHDRDAQETAKRVALANTKNLDQVGILCLTESPDSDQMWKEYANDGRGFALTFNTAHRGFQKLTTPGVFRQVEYSDDPYGTFLGAFFDHGVGPLYRKRMKYAFEREWRSIRMLHRLEPHPRDMFFSEFDPASVNEIIIRQDCSVERELRQLVATDARYGHVRITVQD
jgi:hypothetical protein